MTHGTDPQPQRPTPTPESAAALRGAAEAYNHAAAREAQGKFLNTEEQANFTRHQSAARSHGFNDQDVRAHAATLRSAVQA